MNYSKSRAMAWIIAAGLVVILSPAGFAQTAGKGMLQDFEPDNGSASYGSGVNGAVVTLKDRHEAVHLGRQSLQTDREACRVHHHEHVLDAFVFLAHQRA